MLVYTTLASRLAAARIPGGIKKYTGKKLEVITIGLQQCFRGQKV